MFRIIQKNRTEKLFFGLLPTKIDRGNHTEEIRSEKCW